MYLQWKTIRVVASTTRIPISCCRTASLSSRTSNLVCTLSDRQSPFPPSVLCTPNSVLFAILFPSPPFFSNHPHSTHKQTNSAFTLHAPHTQVHSPCNIPLKKAAQGFQCRKHPVFRILFGIKFLWVILVMINLIEYRSIILVQDAKLLDRCNDSKLMVPLTIWHVAMLLSLEFVSFTYLRQGRNEISFRFRS